MPEFDAERLAGPFGLAHVEAAMLWPTDAYARREFERAIETATDVWLSRLGRGHDPAHLPSAAWALGMAGFSITRSSYLEHIVTQAVLDALDNGMSSSADTFVLATRPRLDDLLNDKALERKLSEINFAGRTLLVVLQAAEAGRPELATISRAIRAWPERRSEASLWADWRRYQGVAPLAAARQLVGFDPQSLDAERFWQWLVQAEYLRRRGEAYVPQHAKSPVLDPSSTWKVPGIDLTEEHAMLLPRLDRAILASLARRDEEGAGSKQRGPTRPAR